MFWAIGSNWVFLVRKHVGYYVTPLQSVNRKTTTVCGYDNCISQKESYGSGDRDGISIDCLVSYATCRFTVSTTTKNKHINVIILPCADNNMKSLLQH